MLPRVLRSNLVKTSLELEQQFPGRLGLLFSPDGWAKPRGLPYALDNGRFPVWAKGKPWDEDAFWGMLEKAKRVEYSPLWLAVPDVVADAEATLASWATWHPRLVGLGWLLALVVQDGMTPQIVHRLRPKPDIIFIGGTTNWKWRTLPTWTACFPRVHVGRANTERMLWSVQMAGAESSDGTGWFHHEQKQSLIRYLARSAQGKRRFGNQFGFCERTK